MLNSRQIGLKMIANVTYGYTGASFSGRMPCIDIADSIVQMARETLENVSIFPSFPPFLLPFPINSQFFSLWISGNPSRRKYIRMECQSYIWGYG